MATRLLHLDDESTFSFLGLRLDDEMIVTVGTVLICFLKLGNLFAEGALAFLAEEDHIHCWHELVVLTPVFRMAFWAIEPLFAAWSANGHLRVQNMSAHNFLFLF